MNYIGDIDLVYSFIPKFNHFIFFFNELVFKMWNTQFFVVNIHQFHYDHQVEDVNLELQWRMKDFHL